MNPALIDGSPGKWTPRVRVGGPPLIRLGSLGDLGPRDGGAPRQNGKLQMTRRPREGPAAPDTTV